AAISEKTRAHAAEHEYAQYRHPITLADGLQSRQIGGPSSARMCAPIGDGAGAVGGRRADLGRGGQRPVWIRASAIGMGVSPGAPKAIKVVAEKAYAKAGLTASDIDVAEVHDSIAFNELLAYEELGFAGPGQGSALVAEGATKL